MKITKTRLREIIREELSTVRENDSYADSQAGLGDLQSEPKFTGGSPEERLLTLMKAREVLAAMGKEELTALSKSLDAEQVAVLRHLLANPMYGGSGLEESNDVVEGQYETGDERRPRKKALAAAVRSAPRTEGLGEPRDTPDGDGLGDNDDGYRSERPVPRSWVDGKPPKRPAKKKK